MHHRPPTPDAPSRGSFLTGLLVIAALLLTQTMGTALGFAGVPSAAGTSPEVGRSIAMEMSGDCCCSSVPAHAVPAEVETSSCCETDLPAAAPAILPSAGCTCRAHPRGEEKPAGPVFAPTGSEHDPRLVLARTQEYVASTPAPHFELGVRRPAPDPAIRTGPCADRSPARVSPMGTPVSRVSTLLALLATALL
ncbi:MAG TPA: hypothetical protein ENJ09_09975 [Planctomycetes bacterium]|nr:hypothetical protein [Planctomycetota bacterium]